MEKIKSLIQPLESSKRNIEEEIIQNNIQRDEWINGEPFWLARCEYIEENN